MEHLPAIAKCAGVITAEANLLSHVAIRARELSVPCAGGVTDILARVKDGQLLTIDGNNGTVYLGEQVSPQANESTGRLIYYNPDRIKAIQGKGNLVLYEDVGDHVVAYTAAVGNSRCRKNAIAALSRALKIDPSQITIDEHGVWEGTNSPSVVYDQYMGIQDLKSNEITTKILDQGIRAAKSFAPDRLRRFLERTDRKAHELFVAAVNKWNAYLQSRSRPLAEAAASLLDRARTYSGDLVGFTILDVYGTYVLENAITSLRSKYGVTLQDVFSAAQGSQGVLPTGLGEDEQLLLAGAVEYARVLEEYKNRRLSVLTYQGWLLDSLIDAFYEEGLDDIVSAYQW